MAAAIEDLESRLVALEQEVMRLRQAVSNPPVGPTSAQGWAGLLERARRDKPRLRAAAAKAFAKMGISGQPVPPEKLREMMAADGVKPEDNLFSRGIVEMRDE